MVSNSILGFYLKGVLAVMVDQQLDKISRGIHILRLRPSMKKINIIDEDNIPIEIARDFLVRQLDVPILVI